MIEHKHYINYLSLQSVLKILGCITDFQNISITSQIQ